MKRADAIKWAKEIEAFQVGKDIQFLDYNDTWTDTDDPCFYTDMEYRVKPLKKIDTATAKVMQELLQNTFLPFNGKQVLMNRIKDVLTEVYGDK